LKIAITTNNVGKIRSRRDKIFEWLWKDTAYLTITTIGKDEIISRDDKYFDMFMYRDKDYINTIVRKKNKFRSAF
jgi:hypothetical protein